MRVPQGTPWPGSERPGGHPLHWHTGCHLSGYVTPLGFGDRWGSFGLLGCWMWDHSSRHPPVPLGDRQANRCGRLCPGHVPWRMSYRPSASDLATSNSTYWRPLVSRHSASHHRKLAWCSWCSPWKKTRRKSDSPNVTMSKDRGIGSQTEQKRKGFKGKYLDK